MKNLHISIKFLYKNNWFFDEFIKENLNYSKFKNKNIFDKEFLIN